LSLDGEGLRFTYLASGSRGNACVVRAGSTTVMIDCGLPVRQVRHRMAERELELDDLDAILVTHEHGDHLRGVGRVARASGAKVWMTPGTHAGWRDPRVPALELFDPRQPFEVGDLQIRPVAVPHDAREPCQYVVEDGHHRLGVLTDLGCATPALIAHYSGLDALALEANHDTGMLRDGPYPQLLKDRVGGDQGHLSNAQAAAMLAALDRTRLQHLVAVHVSEKNNRPALALAALTAAVDPSITAVIAASQDGGTGWISCGGPPA
jgi:phosphoribosyl 1,2-cyclic phosphodiesterase